jgi:hypothetical protein
MSAPNENPKNYLLEHCRRYDLPYPKFNSVEVDGGFVCELTFMKTTVKSGVKRTKKDADMEAAESLLDKIGKCKQPHRGRNKIYDYSAYDNRACIYVDVDTRPNVIFDILNNVTIGNKMTIKILMRENSTVYQRINNLLYEQIDEKYIICELPEGNKTAVSTVLTVDLVYEMNIGFYDSYFIISNSNYAKDIDELFTKKTLNKYIKEPLDKPPIIRWYSSYDTFIDEFICIMD